MSRSLALFAIGLIFGGGAGFVLAADNGVTFDGHDYSDPAHHGGHQAETAAHDHSTTVNLPAGPNAPSVNIAVVKDPMAGWNLHVLPQNCEFAPESASAADQPGKGHAHVYANGLKLARLYGNWMHLAQLPKGEVEIEVALNSHSHNQPTVNGVPVSASQASQVD